VLFLARSRSSAKAQRSCVWDAGATSDTAIGKAAQSAAQQAVRNAVEGGLLSSGEQVSEDTLQIASHGRKISPQWTRRFNGGLVGAGLGFAVLLGSRRRRGARKCGSLLDSAVSKQALKWLDAGKRVLKVPKKRRECEAVGHCF